jgi:hypothetical protein
MAKLTDIKQIAYLQYIGVEYDYFERNGNTKVFIFERDQKEIDRYIADFYKSDFSKYISYLENLKTMVYRT